MLTVLITFLVTTAIYAVLSWWVARRLLRHLSGNREAVRVLAVHVLLPLLGREPKDELEKKKPSPRDARLC